MKLTDLLLEGAYNLYNAEPMKESDVKVTDAGDGKFVVSVTPTSGPLVSFVRTIAYDLSRKRGFEVTMKSGLELPRWAKFKANAVVIKTSSKENVMKAVVDAVAKVNKEIAGYKKAKEQANSPEQKKKDAEFRSKQAKDRKDKLEQEYGKGTWNRVKIRQVGGDDGYQWTLFVDGQMRRSGMMKMEAEASQRRAADEIAKKEKLGKYARQEKAYNNFKKKIGL
jgi:hypothetical protein